MDASAIEHVPGRGFHVDVDGHRSELHYTLSAGRMVITHTLVPAALRGQGLAGHLVRAAFERARAEGWRVETRCSYAAAWAERHPEVADLLAGG